MSISSHLSNSLDALETAVAWMVETFPNQPGQAAAGETSFLEMKGLISGGWMRARGGRAAERQRKRETGDTTVINGQIKQARELDHDH